jgi:hypothetical protein
MLKKLRLFFFYKRKIKEAKFELEQQYNVRIDNAQRLYTVVNVPEELVGEAYSLKKSDIDRISENYIRAFTQELSKNLNSKGLSELYRVYEIKKVDKYSFLLVIGFSLMKSQNLYNFFYYVGIPTIIISSILSILIII